MSVESNTPVDPRVQVELEKLNSATDNINKYEVELEEAKCEFKKLLAESVERIKQSAHKLSNSIQTAKPYYEARLYATQLSKETQLAASNFEKAKSVHAAAKEMVYLAEQGLGEKSTLDTACQEMLSHAAGRVNQSQVECTETRNILKMCELKQEVANNRVAKLQSQLKAAIKASRPYYETRANYNGLLKTQKERITSLESRVAEAKMSYNDALKNLEQISEEIHKMRQEKRKFMQIEQKAAAETHAQDAVDNSTSSFPCRIESCDEYLEIPPKLSTKSSPVRQKYPDQHDCPHLLQDFESILRFPPASTGGYGDIPKSSSDTLCSTIARQQLVTTSPIITNDDIEQWTEIRLSNSGSTSSSYSHHSGSGGGLASGLIDDHTPTGSETSSSDETRKVTCTTVFTMDDGLEEKKRSGGDTGGITTWISRSSSFKTSGRRQSLDLLIDASDKVKDVFTFGMQRVGKSLERRNSESEMNNENSDFFLFSRSDKDHLSDEQVENLLLNDEGDLGLQNMNDISNY
ncbi:guanine nucleotide exchange factor rei-2 isoform X2 [Episyrphus balteatus]|uniref:guanine nucleotide exchange factor rei-2 isoform X2 n=1 Tax=Episyrphus balteatus TaxID=286459 RepID=UPI0024857307|nr:guanine nucleotide exchange factor rei-2 isoform X2 [Episyrphus balteatus]